MGRPFARRSATISTKVLIADDDALLRAVLEHKLTAAGYLVRCAEDGGAAHAAVEEGWPDLVVLDAMMPVMDGFEVLRRLKQTPAMRDIPVVMLTALKRDQDVLSALQIGASDYLSKPFNPDELVARLARLVPLANAR